MAGNREGGLTATETNKAKYGSDFYKRIGAMGGSAKVPKGFALLSPERRHAIATMAGTKHQSYTKHNEACMCAAHQKHRAKLEREAGNK